MSPSTLVHEAPGAPLGDLMSTQCGAHECSQRKRGPMSTRVAHERSRKKMGFADDVYWVYESEKARQIVGLKPLYRSASLLIAKPSHVP